MKNSLAKILAIGIVALLLGAIIFVIGLAAAGWNIFNISGITVTDNTYNEAGTVQNLNINLDTSDLTIIFDESADKISVVYPTEKNQKGELVSEITVTESGNTLSVTHKNSWKKHVFLFNFTDTKIKITVPAKRVMSLNVETDTGDVKLEGNATLANSAIETDTGDIEFKILW